MAKVDVREKLVTVDRADFCLAGTLAYNAVETSRILVVMVPGSGVLDRDFTLGPNRVFKILSDALVREGILTYRYDKRGCFDSGGDFREASVTDFVDDLVFIFRRLQDEIGWRLSQMFLLGASEGAVICLLAAPELRAINGIILMGTPVGSLYELAQEQMIRYYSLFTDTSKQVSTASLREQLMCLSLLKAGKIDEAQLERSKEWYRQLLALNTLELISCLRMPILFLHGANDEYVGSTDVVKLCRLRDRLHSRTQVRVFRNLGHLLMHFEGNEGDPFSSSGVMPSEVITVIVNWIYGQEQNR